MPSTEMTAFDCISTRPLKWASRSGGIDLSSNNDNKALDCTELCSHKGTHIYYPICSLWQLCTGIMVPTLWMRKLSPRLGGLDCSHYYMMLSLLLLIKTPFIAAVFPLLEGNDALRNAKCRACLLTDSECLAC